MRFDNDSERKRFEFAVAQLRHAYQQLAHGNIVASNQTWARTFADGLIAPSIRTFEKMARKADEA